MYGGAGLAVSVGATVDRVRDHPMDGGVTWPAPDDIAMALPRRQLEAMLMEPQQRLTGAAKLGNLLEHRLDRFLDATFRRPRGAGHGRECPIR